MSLSSFSRLSGSQVHGKRLGHVLLYGRFQKAGQCLYGCIFVMMATAAGIGLLFDTSGLQGFLGTHEPEAVAENIPGFDTHGDSGHVAPDAVGECVDGMGVKVFNHSVARQTLLRSGLSGLELCRRHTQLMDVMTRCTRNTFLGVYGLLPVQILLMMGVGALISVNGIYGAGYRFGRLKKRSQGLAGHVAHRPVKPLDPGRLAAAVAATADLGPDSRGQL